MLGLLAEDKSEGHVQTSKGEKEESRDEREVVHVVRENRGSKETLEDSEGPKTEILPEHREIIVEES